MKKDFNERKRAGVKCDRVILYVHGGAYYFGSVGEHRYQMQRHARKLKARVLAPCYRLSPQFPFPCGLHDCIATYFYLLEHFPPNQILFAGDSAGGGMVISMLVTLRDQGLPLPAGAILLSPWVDLTHSFPSVAGEGLLDYIPAAGFHHKPSLAWPPPPTNPTERKYTQPIEQAFDVVELPASNDLDLRSPIHDSIDSESASMMSRTKKNTPAPMNRNMTPGLGDKIEIEIDGKKVLITEQIQMYAKNELLAHPLVSPVQQPSLGGLPPLLIQVGGGELLRDEQIYLAHKAADPRNFPPCDAILDDYDPRRMTLKRYPPTNVQLQVWEDLCHVPHTLSFTRPAKHMYRSVAQFGAWALAHAQHKTIEIPDDDAMSIISDVSTKSNASKRTVKGPGAFGGIGDDGVTSTQVVLESIGAVGRAGDELPPFEDHMIRQRVNRHGLIFPLPHKSEIASLHLDPATIGAIKPGPVRKWLAKRAEMDKKFEKEYKKVQKKREKEAAQGYDPIEQGEDPPLTAMYRRRKRGTGPEEKKKEKKGWGLALWSGWGSSHDEDTLQREEKFVEEKAAEANRSTSGADDRSDVRTLNGAGVSRTNLAVPGRDNDASSVRTARRASASSRLSAAASNREVEIPGRGPHVAVADAGQADSPSSSRTPQPKGSHAGSSWNLSRKSSGASGRPDRPVSVAAPIPVSTLTESSSRVPNMSDMSDTNKEAVLVPGSDNTYINPNSSRPHNNFVAYPFKLRENGTDSPNPSTLTLNSEHHGFRAELPAGGGPAAYEMPTGVESSWEQEDTVASATSAFAPESLIPALVSQEPESVFPSPMSERRTSIFHEESLNGSPKSRDAPVSPLHDSTLLKAAPRSKFESRDSRLGNLGADGMPINAFPGSSSRGASSAAKAPVDRDEDPTSQSAPFKVRNLVQEGRSDRQAPTAAAASSSTPFRLRNGSYDAQNDGTETDSYNTTTIPARRESLKPHPSYSLPIRSSSSKVDPKAPDASPSPHMPVPISSARRLTSDNDVPPTPPPKDISMGEQSTNISSSSSSSRRPPAAAAATPSSSTSAPRLAKMGFESSTNSSASFIGGDRPPLETFVTAREDFPTTAAAAAPQLSKRSASGAPQL
jgi:acetyl esterase/lipase